MSQPKGLIEVLDNKLTYSALFPRLQKCWPFIFDKSIRVRRVFLHLLAKLQHIKSFDMGSFFVLGDFLVMFVYDHQHNPANSINKLYVRFLYPLFWKEVSLTACSHL